MQIAREWSTIQKGREYMQKVLIAGLLILLTGCGGKHSAEYRDMQAMAEKIRSYVEVAFDQGNIDRTGWAVNASCMFAREMNCVSGKSPDTSHGVKDVTRVEAAPEYEARIRRTILNPDGLVDVMSTDGYNDILGWILTSEEQARLRTIRDECGYWDQLKTALGEK